jgi:hypothetical protein
MFVNMTLSWFTLLDLLTDIKDLTRLSSASNRFQSSIASFSDGRLGVSKVLPYSEWEKENVPSSFRATLEAARFSGCGVEAPDADGCTSANDSTYTLRWDMMDSLSWSVIDGFSMASFRFSISRSIVARSDSASERVTRRGVSINSENTGIRAKYLSLSFMMSIPPTLAAGVRWGTVMGVFTGFGSMDFRGVESMSSSSDEAVVESAAFRFLLGSGKFKSRRRMSMRNRKMNRLSSFDTVAGSNKRVA